MGLLALGLALASLGEARGQTVLRQSFVTAGDARSIQLYADEVASWADGAKQVFLLKGRVSIEQGVLNLRCRQAVVWVDQESRKTTGIYNLQVYGEAVTVEEGANNRSGNIALIELGTRGEVRIKSYASSVAQTALPDDPLYVRAVNQVRAAAPPAPPPSSPLAGNYVNDSNVRQVSASSPGVSVGSPSPVRDNYIPDPIPLPSNDPNVQLTQGVAPPAPMVTPVPGDNPTAPLPGPPSAPPPQLPPPTPVPSGMTPLTVPPGNGGAKKLTIRPRSGSEPIAARDYNLPTGETAVVINTGVILTVTDPANNKVLLDIEADRLCLWTKGDSKELFGNLRAPQGETSKSLEFYLSGNVELRNQTKTDTEIIRADEVYYDVNRNVAIALRADLEIRQTTLPYPIHFKAGELQQLNAKLFLAKQTEVYSTILPSDPGLKIQVREAKIEEFDTIKKSIFGVTVYDRKTGKPVEYKQHIFSGQGNVVRLEGVPIFYAPYLTTNVERPLGPLDTVTASYNKIFGFQISTTWDMYELLGLQRPDGARWKLFVDEMTARGPALGTQYERAGKDLLGIENKYEGMLKLYGIYDRGPDILGGDRGQQIFIDPVKGISVPVTHPDFRGRIFGNLNVQELPLGFSVQAQVAALSDQNFLEQYYSNDFLNGPNQETFLYVKQQNGIWAWSVLAEDNLQPWMTHTNWLPKADGYVLGLKIFDLFTYNVHGSAGYGQVRPTNTVPFNYFETLQTNTTGRFDLIQDISLPFTLGAFNIVPYAAVDLTNYTEDLTGADRSRFYGGAGVRASIPFSRLYPDVRSDLFNVDGIFHKIVASVNAYAAHSDTPLSRLPQLDMLNDNTTDQTLRDIRAWQPVFNPSNAFFLTSKLYDPQIYALRRLVDTNVDTLDSMQVIQLDLRQRWQTKRGDPAQEHVIDWMTLDVRASLYPQAQKDNFGNVWGDIEYDWVWNIGDRTALVSNGWFEPIDHGPRIFNVGMYIGRNDRTNFYLGYRQIDPLQSRAVVTSLTYAFSAKYAVTFGSNFDFGNNIQSNSLMVTRIGTDLTVSLGFTYNSIVKTFGVQFEIVPNLLPMTGRLPGTGGFGTAGSAVANR